MCILYTKYLYTQNNNKKNNNNNQKIVVVGQCRSIRIIRIIEYRVKYSNKQTNWNCDTTNSMNCRVRYVDILSNSMKSIRANIPSDSGISEDDTNSKVDSCCLSSVVPQFRYKLNRNASVMSLDRQHCIAIRQNSRLVVRNDGQLLCQTPSHSSLSGLVHSLN